MNHSTFQSFTLGIGLFFTLPLVYGNSSSSSSFDGTLYINKSKTHKVASVKYGFHYEEIGMMGEGALHAELIRNRSFEEATPPAGLSVKNGLYENVPAPRVKEKKVFQADPLIGWTTYPLSYTPVFISRTDENPMSGENKYSMQVNVTEDIANHPDALILNRGYYGMNLKTDTSYRLSYRFDNYKRGVADLFIGELGISGKYPYNLLATGAIRMSIERNGDLNPLFAERPVMRHWDFLEHRIFLPMLINGVDSSVKTSFFYLAKMFRDNTFDVCLDAAIKDIEGLQNIFVTMGYDTASKQYILKLINLQDKKVILQPEVSGFKRPVKVHKTSLVLVPGKENTPFAPNEVQPVETEVGLDLNQPLELEAASMVVYRFK